MTVRECCRSDGTDSAKFWIETVAATLSGPTIGGLSRSAEGPSRSVGADKALRIGLANEVVPREQVLPRALELAREIANLPQGAIRTDKETVMRNVGRTLEEQLRNEAEAVLSMWLRKDSHTIGARSFKERRKPEWPNRGL